MVQSWSQDILVVLISRVGVVLAGLTVASFLFGGCCCWNKNGEMDVRERSWEAVMIFTCTCLHRAEKSSQLAHAMQI